MAPRMRTIQEAAAELRRIDPDTAITPYFIRRLVLDGTIPHVSAGNKRLVNLDTIARLSRCLARSRTGNASVWPDSTGIG